MSDALGKIKVALSDDARDELLEEFRELEQAVAKAEQYDKLSELASALENAYNTLAAEYGKTYGSLIYNIAKNNK